MSKRSGWIIAVLAALLLAGVAWVPPILTPSQDRVAADTLDTRCADVLSDFQLLQSDVIELDRVLMSRVMAMRSASGDERLDAIELLVEELVEQRAAERQLMKCAHQKLVAHLLEHLATEPGRLDGCPVMRVMRYEQRPGSGSAMVGPMEY